jgi:hypothetical protein
MTDSNLKTLHSKPASYGVLEHCLTEANKLMSILMKTVEIIDVTGQLKHEYINGHTQIELLAIPNTSLNMFGEPRHNSEMHYLLIDTIHDLAWIEDEPPNYEWEGKHYLWKLTTLKDASQWTIAQIIHTGPDYFAKWLTSTETHRKGALPWGYSIKDYTLFNNNNEPIAINSESEFFETLGYLPISLKNRSDGHPQYWRGFKLV